MAVTVAMAKQGTARANGDVQAELKDRHQQTAILDYRGTLYKKPDRKSEGEGGKKCMDR